MMTPEAAPKPTPPPPPPPKVTKADILVAVQAVGTQVTALAASVAALQSTVAAIQQAVSGIPALKSDLDAFEAASAQQFRTLTAVGLSIQNAQAHP